jgi:ribosomal protein L7/L12
MAAHTIDELLSIDRGTASHHCLGVELDGGDVSIVLVGVIDATKKIAVIKCVRERFPLDLRAAKDAVDKTPSVLGSTISRHTAFEIARAIEAAGGIVELRESPSLGESSVLVPPGWR